MKIYALVLVAAVLAACCTTPSSSTSSPPSGPVDSPDTCGAFCAAMRAIPCPEGGPSATGESCEALCTRAQGGGKMSLPLSCGAAAKTVDEARVCGVRCKPRPVDMPPLTREADAP